MFHKRWKIWWGMDEWRGRRSRYEQKYKGKQRGWWMNTFVMSAVLKKRSGKANRDDAQCHSNSEVSWFYSVPSKQQPWALTAPPSALSTWGLMCVPGCYRARLPHWATELGWATPRTWRGIAPAGPDVSNMQVSIDCLPKGQREGQLR